jgi:hypothetical protein
MQTVAEHMQTVVEHIQTVVEHMQPAVIYRRESEGTLRVQNTLGGVLVARNSFDEEVRL